MYGTNKAIFFQNRVKINLYKNIEIEVSCDQLRGIGILTAWIITVKKAMMPIILNRFAHASNSTNTGHEGEEFDTSKFQLPSQNETEMLKERFRPRREEIVQISHKRKISRKKYPY